MTKLLGSLAVKVRGYEIDRWKRVPLSNLLRFTEHARWEFAIEESSPVKELFADDAFLVVRSQYGTLLESATLGDKLNVDLRIGHVGGSSLTFEQRITKVSSSRDMEPPLVARVFVVTVYVGPDKRPRRLPADFRQKMADFIPPEGPLSLEDPPVGLEGFEIQIRNSDLDLLQHVNHARYVDFLQDTRAEAALRGALKGPGGHPERSPSSFSIDYIREIRPHERVIGYAWNNDHSRDIFLAGLVAGEAQPRFRGRLSF